MWYVIQTVTGNEHELKALLDAMLPEDSYDRSFVPLYEEVLHRAKGSRITFKRLFPGYLFVETDDPEAVFDTLRRIPDFARLLGSPEPDGTKTFLPVGAEDEEFLRSLLDDGLMHVSYVHLSSAHRIDRVAGPLARYRNHITKMEFRHRYALVELTMFGKKRRIRFGLWGDGDPALPWLERELERKQSAALDEGVEIDIGLRPGDRVLDTTGVYGDYEFVIDRVDAVHRTLRTKIELFGDYRTIELFADDVRKVTQ